MNPGSLIRTTGSWGGPLTHVLGYWNRQQFVELVDLGTLDMPGIGGHGHSDSVRGRLVLDPYDTPRDDAPWAPESSRGGAMTSWYAGDGWSVARLLAWKAMRAQLPDRYAVAWDVGSALFYGLRDWDASPEHQEAARMAFVAAGVPEKGFRWFVEAIGI